MYIVLFIYMYISHKDSNYITYGPTPPVALPICQLTYDRLAKGLDLNKAGTRVVCSRPEFTTGKLLDQQL